MTMPRLLARSIATFATLLALAGCSRREGVVTLYTSVDQPIAAPIVEAFERDTGIKVRLVTDTEASKSVGLVERLRAERSHPVADVFWNNEPFRTVTLAEQGLFATLEPPADAIPEAMRDRAWRWAGSGVRVRVLATNNKTGPIAKSLDDLLDPQFDGRVAIARPLAGTTGGHVAALYVLWGDEKADAFFRTLHDHHALVVGGNGPVADAVGGGQVLIGLTDNDDVANARENGGKLEAVLPDQDSIGTLAMPTTVALVAKTEVSADARRLAAYLLSADVEKNLIAAHFAVASVRDDASVRLMKVDFDAVARRMVDAPQRAADLLDGRPVATTRAAK